MADSIYDITCLTLDQHLLPLAEYRGRILLIVNTASYCGFTPQFRGLEYLYRTYREQGLVVLGFPCNQFIQEPGHAEQIGEFCVRNYGVTFPLFDKVKVNGKDCHPLYAFLKPRARGMLGSVAIKWNFTKFLVDRRGQVMGRYGPATTPRRLAQHIEALLE